MNGVHGPVSALITTEKRFVTAIDTASVRQRPPSWWTARAWASSAFRTSSARTAAARPSLPLDTIRANSLRETGLERQNGCFGTADALVRFNEKI